MAEASRIPVRASLVRALPLVGNRAAPEVDRYRVHREARPGRGSAQHERGEGGHGRIPLVGPWNTDGPELWVLLAPAESIRGRGRLPVGSLSPRSSAGLVLARLEASDQLSGPDPLLSPSESATPAAVTGGGLLALVDPKEGLVGAWRGTRPVLGRLTLVRENPRDAEGSASHVEDSLRPAARETIPFRCGGGRWERTLLLSDGTALLERGLLPDDPAAVVVQWSIPAGGESAAALFVRTTAPEGGSPTETSIRVPPGGSATVALIPEGDDKARATSLLRSLVAREKLRAGRLASDDLLRFRRDGALDRALHAALVGISDALPEGSPHLPVPDLVDVGRAGLRGGLRYPALFAMDTLGLMAAGEEAPPSLPLGFLRLVADWIAWTGDLGGISRRREAIESAARSAGLGLSTDLGTLRDALPSATPPTHPDARILLDRIDGETNGLGALPDARYGRLRLAPLLTGAWTSLEVDGLSAGDAKIDLRVWREASRIDVHLRQRGGKVPINLVFEPRVSANGVGEVRIGGATANVERSTATGPEGEGPNTKLRCQFPLDPERTVTILIDPR